MIQRLLTTICIIAFTASSIFGKSRKVLFIGNSYTAGLPAVIEQLSTSMGDTLVFTEVAPGGYTLQGHSTNMATLNAIKQDKWDVIVIQEQSQRPAFSPAQVASDTYPYAKILVDSIKANHSCSEPMFYMTWGRKNGDASNCAAYPPICTYSGMQARLKDSYLEMAKDNSGSVAPVGEAWKTVRDSVPSIDLYQPDESHPSTAGTYLAACVFYASIFHNSPIGSSFTSGLSTTDAERLQYFASKVVLGSINNWVKDGNYTVVEFSFNKNMQNVTFQNNSINATNYSWSFGDGNNSGQTAPMHTYTQNGKFGITLTASNSCFTTSKTDSVQISAANIQSTSSNKNIVQIANIGNNTVSIQILNSDFNELSIYNMTGKKLRSYNNDKHVTISNLPSGIYVYRLSSKSKQLKGKFVVY